MTRGRTQVTIGLLAFMGTACVVLGFGSAPASEAAPRLTAPVAAVASGSASDAGMLADVRPGLWIVRGEGLATQRLCVGDPAALVRLRHGEASCTQLVVSADPRTTTVQYSCRGAGWGRTTITRQDADTLRIDTQGIAGNAPFADQAEARREGDCRPGAL